MALPTLHYRLRIRDHEDTVDSLIISSVPTDAFPYIRDVPTGEGQTLDPVMGKVSVGAYTVRVIDVLTSTVPVTPFTSADGFEYADTAAFLAAWTETDPDGFLTATLDTAVAPYAGASSAKLVGATGGPYANSGYIAKTFGGFTAGATVTVSLWINQSRRSFGHVPTNGWGLTANGTTALIADGVSAGVWSRISVDATADGSGNVVVQIGAFIATPAPIASPPYTLYVDGLTLTQSPTATINSRIITAALADQDARQDLLSRKAYIEESLDGGFSWDVLCGGYINKVALSDAITYEFTVGESKRIEQSARVFDRISPSIREDGSTSPYIGVLDRTCCVIGGPIVGDFALTADRGRPTYRVTGTTTGTGPDGTTHTFIAMDWIAGFLFHGAFHEGGGPQGQAIEPETIKFLYGFAADYVANEAQITLASGHPASPFPNMVARLYNSGDESFIRDLTPWSLAGFGSNNSAPFDWAGRVLLEWPEGVALPSAGDTFKFAMFPAVVGPRNPIHVSGHPVGIANQLLNFKGVTTDTASVTTVTNAIGDMTIDLRIFQGAVLDDWLTDNLYGPFGFTTRGKDDGTREFITTRIRPTAPPDFTLVVDNLTSDDGPGWELDETSAAAKVTLETKSFRYDDSRESSVPGDALGESKVVLELTPQDQITVFGDREIAFKIPGLIRGLASGTKEKPGTLDLWAANQYGRLFDWMGRGQVLGTFHALRGLDALVGDEINVQVAYVPTADPTDTPTSQRGSHARRAQILRRTETPTGPTVYVLDRGAGIDDPGVIYDPIFVRIITQCTSYDPPTGLAGAVNGTAAALTWTNGEADLPVEVLFKLTTDTVYTSATTLPAGSTSYTLILPDAGTDYDVAVRHRENPPGLCTSDLDETTVTTVDLLVLQPPTDPQAFADGHGAYGLRVTAVELAAAVEVYFAPETAVGSATAGAYTLLATVPSVAGFDATIANASALWPNNGTLVFLKARHVQSGFTPSDYTDEVSINPWAIVPPTPEPPVDPIDPPIGLTVLTVPVTLITGDGLGFRDIPADATPLTDWRGTEKRVPLNGATSAFIGATIVSTTAPLGCVLAIQYEDPDTPDSWTFLDGVNGPVLALDADTLDTLDVGGGNRTTPCWVVSGNPIAILDAAAQANVRYRAVILGGTGAECVLVSELTVWLTTMSADAPVSEPKDPPLENPPVDDPCTASGGVEGFDNYVDTVDLETDWSVIHDSVGPPAWTGTMTLDPTGGYGGGQALKLSTIAVVGGGSHQGPRVRRVITGVPNGAVARLRGKAKIVVGSGSGATLPQSAICRGTASLREDTFATTGDWEDFDTGNLSNAVSANAVTIDLGWGSIAFFTAHSAEMWFDNLELSIDGVVVDICGGSGSPLPDPGPCLGDDCDDPDPIPDPPAGGYPPPPTGGARPFMAFNIPSEGFGFWNGSPKDFTPTNTAALIDKATDGNAFLLVQFGSGERDWKVNVNGFNGTFVFDRWKATVDAVYNNSAARTALEAAQASGVAFAHFMIDEPFQKGPRYGGTVPLGTLDRMAAYSKSLWPEWPTMITCDLIDQAWYMTRKVEGLDWISSDYMLVRGDVTRWRDGILSRAASLGYGAILGPHYGAFDRAGSGRVITPSELRHYGGIIASTTASVAMLGWKYTSAMYAQAGFTDALKYVRDLYASFDP